MEAKVQGESHFGSLKHNCTLLRDLTDRMTASAPDSSRTHSSTIVPSTPEWLMEAKVGREVIRAQLYPIPDLTVKRKQTCDSSRKRLVEAQLYPTTRPNGFVRATRMTRSRIAEGPPRVVCCDAFDIVYASYATHSTDRLITSRPVQLERSRTASHLPPLIAPRPIRPQFCHA
jgi:hypothetical protein